MCYFEVIMCLFVVVRCSLEVAVSLFSHSASLCSVMHIFVVIICPF